MIRLNSKVTDAFSFYQNNDPLSLVDTYGSPLYVYNERILRKNCRELMSLADYPHFSVNFSAKANGSLALLQIIRDEGLHVDAMSPGEIFVEMAAGFESNQILFIPNNVSGEEMRYAVERNVLVSVDSLSQLDRYGQLFPHTKVAVRFNPGIGAGHHKKVVTGGKDTKFGVNEEFVPDVKLLLKKYDLTLSGINQHIGSLFMESRPYIEGIVNLLELARQFDDLDFIDFGGGFGIPYHKQDDEPRLDMRAAGEKLSQMMWNFSKEYGKELAFKIEPGRYVTAEAGVLLGTVHAIKNNGSDIYAGTDLGFNVLARPTIYDAHHDIEVYRDSEDHDDQQTIQTVVGNICETGDIIAKKRNLPVLMEGDVLGVLDAGSYGHSMSSNYNNRLRPAEVLIRENSEVVLIRERDSMEDLIRHYRGI